MKLKGLCGHIPWFVNKMNRRFFCRVCKGSGTRTCSMALGTSAQGWRPTRGLSLAELTAVGEAHPECSTADTINRLDHSLWAIKIDLETEGHAENQQGTVGLNANTNNSDDKIHIHKIAACVDQQTQRTTLRKHTGTLAHGEDGNEIGEPRSKGNRIKDYFKTRFPFLFLLWGLHI